MKFPGYFALSVGFYLIQEPGDTQLRPQLPMASVLCKLQASWHYKWDNVKTQKDTKDDH